MKIGQIKHKVHDGFTLVELVVVIGIIGILLLTVIPSMRNYYISSRISTANSNAKIIFNSAQTIMQEYEFSERTSKDSFFYGPATTGSDHTGVIFMKGSNGTITSVSVTDTAGSTGDFLAGHEAALGASATPTSASFGGRLSRLFSDYSDVAWCVYIENYSVRGVISASTETNQYIGGYPLKASEVGDLPAIGDSILSTTEPEMKQYCTIAWT